MFSDSNFTRIKFTHRLLMLLLVILLPICGYSNVVGKKILTQAMMAKANTTYEIRYDYDLNGATITIPANCVLNFKGGSLRNGTIIGNNTNIIAKRKQIFGSDITIGGTWSVKTIYIEWIEIPNKKSCGPQVKCVLKLLNDNVKQTIYFPNYSLAYDPLPSKTDNRARTLINLSSNTHLVIPNSIIINTNKEVFYEAIYCYNKKNVEISGGGEIIGDVRTHIFDEPSEFGHGMRCIHSDNVSIKNITFKECIGDGFCTGGTGPAEAEYHYSKGCKNVSLINCTFDSNRRQGVSLTCAQDGLVIDGCKFINTGAISSTLPTAGIDFEPNGDHDTFHNCIVRNCEFANNVGAQFYTYRANFDGLYVDKCKFIAPCEVKDGVSEIYGSRSVSLHGTFKNTKISNSVMNAYVTTDKFRTGESIIEIENCDLKGFYTFNLESTGPIDKCYTIKFNRCKFNIEKINYRYAPFFIRNATTDIIFNNCQIINKVNLQTRFENLFIYRSGYASHAKFEAHNCTIDLKDKPSDFTVLKKCKVKSSNVNGTIR